METKAAPVAQDGAEAVLTSWINHCIAQPISHLGEITSSSSCLELVLEITESSSGIPANEVAHTAIDKMVRNYFQDRLGLDYDYFINFFQHKQGKRGSTRALELE